MFSSFFDAVGEHCDAWLDVVVDGDVGGDASELGPEDHSPFV